MKALRTIGILVLVAGLMLGSVGTVFAKGPPHDPPGKLPKFEGKKRGFAGNVTGVIDGNVTIDRGEEPSVIVRLPEDSRYKIPGVMNKWGNLTEFKEQLEGNTLDALFERRVVTLAGNLTETEEWKALQFMLLPVPGVQGLPPLHAHRTGNVTEFNPWIEVNGELGNITIEDVHGVSHTFVVDGNTTFRPRGTTSSQITIGSSFVTVVTTGDPKVEQPVAKAIVVHRWRHRISEGSLTPTP